MILRQLESTSTELYSQYKQICQEKKLAGVWIGVLLRYILHGPSGFFDGIVICDDFDEAL